MQQKQLRWTGVIRKRKRKEASNAKQFEEKLKNRHCTLQKNVLA